MRGGGNGGDGRAVELLRCMRGWHTMSSAFESSEGAMGPRPYDRLGAVDSGGLSSAITPWRPSSVARPSAVLPSLPNF